LLVNVKYFYIYDQKKFTNNKFIKSSLNSAGDLSEGIIRPIVSASALTWLIRYILYRNLQFLNHVIIIKTKVLLPEV